MSQPQPGRPLPAYVYRRRRLAVLGVLVLLIVLLTVLIAHPWTGGSPKAVPTVVGIPAATGGPSASPAATTNAAACAKGSVKVQALTDATTYRAGQYPKLTMQVTNTGSSACSLNVGTSQQKFSITSNGETYWLSTDCLTDSGDYQLVLQPNTPVLSEPINWDRTRSNPGTCSLATRDAVPANGTSYTLTVSVGGFSSDSSTTFTLN